MATLGLYLAGGEDKLVAHQVCFVCEHLGQLLARVSGQLPQPQQVVVDGHPCYGLGSWGAKNRKQDVSSYPLSPALQSTVLMAIPVQTTLT